MTDCVYLVNLIRDIIRHMYDDRGSTCSDGQDGSTGPI